MARQRTIYRKVALDRLASPEQLDSMLRVTNARSWLVLIGLFAILGAIGVWGLLGVLPTRVHGPGILVRSGGLFDVVASESGRLASLNVRVGDDVLEGQVVGTLAQPALEEELARAAAALAELRGQHRLLSGFGQQDRLMTRETLAQQRVTLEHGIRLAQERRSWLQERLASQEELLERGLITRQALVVTKQQIASARQEVGAAKSEIKRLKLQEQEHTTREEQDLSARELAISEQEREVTSLEERLARASQIHSPHSGRVVEVRTAEGRLVAPGTPLFNLELRATTADADLQALVYLSPRDGKQVRPGMRIEIAPSTVRPEEFGRMVAVVATVAEFPATRQALQADLANEDLVQRFVDETGGAPVAVRADLQRQGAGPAAERGLPEDDRFVWTSSGGPDDPVRAGTLCAASVVVREQRPLELVIPRVRDALGL